MTRLQHFLPDVVFWAIHVTLAFPALWLLALHGMTTLDLIAYMAWLLIIFPIAYIPRHLLRRSVERRERAQRWAKVVSDFYQPDAKR